MGANERSGLDRSRRFRGWKTITTRELRYHARSGSISATRAGRDLSLAWDAQGGFAAPAEDEIDRETEAHYRSFEPYFEERGRFRLDPEGRAAKHTHWDQSTEADEWCVAQMLVDSDEQNDWEALFTVSLKESRLENRAIVNFVEVRVIGAS